MIIAKGRVLQNLEDLSLNELYALCLEAALDEKRAAHNADWYAIYERSMLLEELFGERVLAERHPALVALVKERVEFSIANWRLLDDDPGDEEDLDEEDDSPGRDPNLCGYLH